MAMFSLPLLLDTLGLIFAVSVDDLEAVHHLAKLPHKSIEEDDGGAISRIGERASRSSCAGRAARARARATGMHCIMG